MPRPAGSALRGRLLLLSSASAGGTAVGSAVPACDLQSCGRCFADARAEASNLTVLGPDRGRHSVPLRIGRCTSTWDSQAVYAQIVGILATERLGIAVEYVDVWDELDSWFGVNNCIGWADYECDQYQVVGEAGLARKLYPDPLSDLMFVAEVTPATTQPGSFNGTQLAYEDRPSVVLGPSGYTETDGFFTFASVVQRCESEGLDLGWFPDYAATAARSCTAQPEELMADKVAHEQVGCDSDELVAGGQMARFRELGFTCNSSWWLNPACAELQGDWTSSCIVFIDDSWTDIKPLMQLALARTAAPVARVVVGMPAWQELVTEQRYAALFYWWTFDATFPINETVRVALPTESEMASDVALKVAWGPVLQSSPNLRILLESIYIPSATMQGLMEAVGAARTQQQPTQQAGAGLFQAVACGWLRANEATWTAWLPTARDCSAGEVFDEAAQGCAACPPGRSASHSGHACVDCPAGTFSGSERVLECTACLAGRFSAAAGSSAAEACLRCPLGTYSVASGQTGCAACNATFSTASPGAADPADCTCPAGTFLWLEQGGAQKECAPCARGLLCPGGREPPLQAGGFAVDAFAFGGPTRIKTCDSEVKCPDGTPLGSCPPHREGPACDLCAPTFYEAQGQCKSCRDSSSLAPLAVFISCALLAVAGLVCIGLREPGTTSGGLVLLVLTASLLLTALQTLSAFQRLTSHWVEPLASLYDFLRLFSLNLDILRPSCVFKTNRPDLAYLGSVLLHPIFAVVLTVAALSLRLCGRAIGCDQLANLHGQAALSVYISLTITALLPWQCSANPDGTYSVATKRAVECWTTPTHGLMISLSVVALLIYVVGALGVATWATWRYPLAMTTGRGWSFIRRFHFLFFRFKPKRYYFILIFMVRGLLVAVLPVLLVNKPHAALMLLTLVVALACAAQCLWQPWRAPAGNVLDGAIAIFLLQVLTGCALVMHSDKAVTVEDVRRFYAGVFIVVAVLLACAAGSGAWRWCSRPKMYGAFLCHHKQAAAVLARWFKTLLVERTAERVFLDCDELRRFERFFGVVAHETKYLVVLLTADTMRRIWCAGEMATAVRYGTEIIPVACGDFVEPSDVFIDSLDSEWSDAQKNEAFMWGVRVVDIQEAYFAIRNIERIGLDRRLPQGAQEAVVDAVFSRCRRLKGTSAGSLQRLGVVTAAVMGPAAREASGVSIVLVGDTEDPEAACVPAILRRLVQVEVCKPVALLEPGEADGKISSHPQARHLLVVLTHGALRSPHVAATLVEVQQRPILALPIIADDAFRVPDAMFYGALAGCGHHPCGVALAAALQQHPVILADVAPAYRNLFGELALRFSARSSLRIQAAELRELMSRVRGRTRPVKETTPRGSKSAPSLRASELAHQGADATGAEDEDVEAEQDEGAGEHGGLAAGDVVLDCDSDGGGTQFN